MSGADARHDVFDVDGMARLEVDVRSGSVRVDRAAGDSVEVSVQPADGFDVERTGATVRIRQLSSWGFRGRGSVVAAVPEGSELEITAASAEVRALGVFGRARVRTSSGDVELGTAQRVEVTTASGDVRLTEIGGDVSINSASGDLAARAVGGALSTSTASGDVRVDWVGADVHVSTASGDVHVGRCDGEEIDIKTLSGDIGVGLPGGIRVRADISTLSGRVHLPDATPTPVTGERREVRLHLRSASGDVRVVRTDPG